MLKIEGDIPFGKDQFYRRLYGWVARVAPSHIYTNVCKCSFETGFHPFSFKLCMLTNCYNLCLFIG